MYVVTLWCVTSQNFVFDGKILSVYHDEDEEVLSSQPATSMEPVDQNKGEN